MFGMFSLLFALLTPPPDGLVVELTSLLDTQIAAWNRGDLAAFCDVYAEDAAFLSPTGLTRGRAQVLARYQKRYPDPQAMGTLSLAIEEVRGTADGAVASVAARWKLSWPGKPAAEGLTLIVFQRPVAPPGDPTARAGRWLIVQDASM